MTDKEIEEAAEKYCIEWHNTYTDGMTVANYCNAEVPETCFLAGAYSMQPKIAELEGKLKLAVEALEYYANHPSVIKEAYHTGVTREQIQVVHTFINHKAKLALDKIREGENGKAE